MFSNGHTTINDLLVGVDGARFSSPAQLIYYGVTDVEISLAPLTSISERARGASPRTHGSALQRAGRYPRTLLRAIVAHNVEVSLSVRVPLAKIDEMKDTSSGARYS